MVSSNRFYQKKIEQQNEKLTAMNQKLDSLVSNIYSEKLKSNSLVSNLNLKVDSLVSNIDYLKLKSNSSKLIIFIFKLFK